MKPSIDDAQAVDVDRRGHSSPLRLAVEDGQRMPVVADARQAVEQPARVGMLRVRQVGRRQLLDDPAGIHDEDPVAEGRDQAQIVGDEDQPHAAVGDQPVEDAPAPRAAP